MIALRLLAAAPVALLAGCMGQPMGPDRDPAGEARLAQALAGMVAGPPVSCLSNLRTNNMEVIDRDTIIYRDGATTYVQHTNGHCYPSGRLGGYALVTRPTMNGNCRGDIAQVFDTATRTLAGSCTFNDFVPYRRR